MKHPFYSEAFPGDTSLMIGISRVYDMLNDTENSIRMYKQVRPYTERILQVSKTF